MVVVHQTDIDHMDISFWHIEVYAEHFADGILKHVLLNENVGISIKFRLKFDPGGTNGYATNFNWY